MIAALSRAKVRARGSLAVALCALVLSVAVVIPAKSPGAPASWREDVLGPSDGVNTASWSGNRVLWDYSDDGTSGVEVWDDRSNTTQQLESDPTAECGATDSFWYAGRVYWLRSGRHEIVSAEPAGGAIRRVVSRPGMEQLTSAGDRAVWIERSAGTRQWSISSMMMPTGRVERIAEISSPFTDIVVSGQVIAWVECGEDDSNPEREIHVQVLEAAGNQQARIDIPASVSPSGTYEPDSLAISGSRLAWFAGERVGTNGVYTWRVGDAAPTRAAARGSLGRENLRSSMPAVSDGLVAWLQGRRSVNVWRSGHATTKLVPLANEALPLDLAVSGERVAWTQFEGAYPSGGDPAPGTIQMWDAETGSTMSPPAPIVLDSEPNGLKVHENQFAYVRWNREKQDYFLHLVQPADAESSSVTIAPAAPRHAVSGVQRGWRGEIGIWVAASLVVVLLVTAGTWALTRNGRRERASRRAESANLLP